MKKRELLTDKIEQGEVSRLCVLYSDILPDVIRGIFHVGFGFGLCEGVGAAKRRKRRAQIAKIK